MRKILFIICLLYACADVSAQRMFRHKFFGLSMELPAGWLAIDTAATAANFSDYSFSPEQLEKVMERYRGSVKLLTLSKRAPSETAGIIPTIKIGARYTRTKEIGLLSANLEQNINDMMHSFAGFQYEQPFTVTNLNGQQAIKTVFTYSLPANGQQLRVRTFMYVFLQDSYFIQVSFSDTEGQEDESALYNRLIQTLHFNKTKS